MPTQIVLTVTGKDRVGLVDQVTQVLLDHGGDVEASRMAHLGGEFAMLMLVALPPAQQASLERDLEQLAARGYKVTTTLTEGPVAPTLTGSQPYQIQVHGADHEGIIHEIAHYLAQRGINIESMDTETYKAPISGNPLFSMTALVVVPLNLQEQDWQAALDEVGHHLNVDIEVAAAQVQ
jgi:glycine cleavage system transcriptional repressor